MEKKEIERTEWMELNQEKEIIDGHKQISTAIQDLGRMGYRIKGISVNSGGFLNITCYCPQVNEGSKEAKT
jgi:hypothetical protein